MDERKLYWNLGTNCFIGKENLIKKVNGHNYEFHKELGYS